MLHIPNSAKENCLTEKENHTICLKSDIKSINLRITKIIIMVRNSPAFDCHVFCFFWRPLIYGFWRNAHDQYTNPLARPLLIALQVVRTSFGFHLRECMGSSFPPPPYQTLSKIWRWLVFFGCTYEAINSMQDLVHSWVVCKLLFSKSRSLSLTSHMNVF